MNLTNYVKARLSKFQLAKVLTPSPPLELPYEDLVFAHGRTFVLLKDGRIGAGLRLQWPHHLVINDQELEELEATLGRFLQRLNPSFAFQLQTSKQKGVYSSFAFLTSAPAKVALRFLPKAMVSSQVSKFEDTLEQIHSALDSFSSAIAGDGSASFPLEEKDLIAILAQRLGDEFPTNKGIAILNSMPCEWSNQEFRIGAKAYEALVPTSLPSIIASQVLRPLMFEEGDFHISVGLRALSKEETEARINQRKFWLQNALGAGALRQREEVETFERDFAAGERLIALSLAVFSSDPKTTASLRNTLSQSTLSPWAVESAGIGRIFLDSLPFLHDSHSMASIGRTVFLPSQTSARLLPLCSGSIARSNQKALVYPSVDGEPTGFDLRDTPGGHTAVIAGTRSGKSFLINNMLHRYLSSPNPPVVSILDKRASYETLARFHGGSVVTFTPENLKRTDFPFHPLAGTYDASHLDFLSSYICLLAELAKPDQPVYAVEKVLVTEALRIALESVQVSDELSGETSSTLTMSDVVSALGRSNEPSAKSLASRFKPFYGSGTYAAYFDREHQSSSSLSSNVLSFDLDGLETDPLLQSAMSQAILGQVLARMRQASQAGQWGILLVEEIGVLGDSIGGLAQFVADAWKTMAKMGVLCIGVTNDVEDYLHKPAPKAIWNNSPNKIFLRMTSDQIRHLVSATEFGPPVVTGQLKELLPCLKTIPGSQADFILTAEDRIYPLTFKPDQTSYWLATSKHEDILKLKTLCQSMSVADAIQKLAGEI